MKPEAGSLVTARKPAGGIHHLLARWLREAESLQFILLTSCVKPVHCDSPVGGMM